MIATEPIHLHAQSWESRNLPSELADVSSSTTNLEILASDALTKSDYFIALHEDDHLRSKSSTFNTTKAKARTDEAVATSGQNTGSTRTCTTTTVKPPEPQAILPSGSGSTERKDESTRHGNTRAPPRSKGIVKRLAKRYHRVLCSLPNHVAPRRTLISDKFGIYRQGESGHETYATWVVHHFRHLPTRWCAA